MFAGRKIRAGIAVIAAVCRNSLAEDAEIVQAAYRDYQELLLSREGLKNLYGVTLTLALLLSLFSALAAAFLISERLSAPLGMLAEGTRAVAQGDFSRRHPVRSRDELGVLTESFNLDDPAVGGSPEYCPAQSAGGRKRQGLSGKYTGQSFVRRPGIR